MQTEELQQLIANTLDDMKASNVIKLDVRHLTSITDMMIFASGTSTRQVKAIAQKLDELDKHGAEIIGIEGMEEAQWVLMDFADVVVHIMHPETREYYQLEKLWSVERTQDEDRSMSS